MRSKRINFVLIVLNNSEQLSALFVRFFLDIHDEIVDIHGVIVPIVGLHHHDQNQILCHTHTHKETIPTVIIYILYWGQLSFLHAFVTLSVRISQGDIWLYVGPSVRVAVALVWR